MASAGVANLDLSGMDWRAVAVLVLGAAGLVWYARSQVKAAAQTAAENAHLIDPTDERNAANQAVNAVGEAVTGETGWTLGGQIYDWTHDDANNPSWIGGVLDSMILN